MLRHLAIAGAATALVGSMTFASAPEAAANEDYLPTGFTNDDLAWRNNGVYVENRHVVRVYDRSTVPDQPTLCINRGRWARWSDNSTAGDAAQKGNYFRWCGKCGSGEPEI